MSMGVVRRRIKRKVKGEVRVVSREEYDGLDVSAKVELIRALVPLGLGRAVEMLEEEVESLVGKRWDRRAQMAGHVRGGNNPGTVMLARQPVPVRVPRVRDGRRNREVGLKSYRRLRAGTGQVDEVLLRRVLYGLSSRNYELAAEAVPGAIGLSSSTVSRRFREATAARLREFKARDLSGYEFVALFVDGKTFADDEMVVALGVTVGGEKMLFDFVETSTENEKACLGLFEALLGRGLDVSEGILAVIDGSRGLVSALRRAFRDRVVVQRCQWHKRENVVSYLAKGEQAYCRKRLTRAYSMATYEQARSELERIRAELEEVNLSAVKSLDEGFEETLALHRLGLVGSLGRSFKTTNCLESVMAAIEERCAKADCWKNSSQKHRWLATSLLHIEPRLRLAMGYRHLPRLKEALRRELKLEEQTAEVAVA